MKKPLIGSVSRTGRNSCASRMPPSDSRWRQRLTRPAVVAASDVTAADGEVVLAAREGRQHHPAASSRRAAGRRRSPRRIGLRTSSAPSITAEARPRRPMRRMQRTRGSVWAMRRTSAVVPSGLLSSTYIDLPGDAVQRGVQPGDQWRDIGAFVVAGHHNGQRRRAARDRRELDQRGGGLRTCLRLCHAPPVRAEPLPGGDWCGSSGGSAHG